MGRLELDGHDLAADLFRAYLDQILIDGFFHADPHPGNVLLTDDGRLALIDMGMVARVAPDTQDALIKLLLAVSGGRGDDAADVMVGLGEKLAGLRRRRVPANASRRIVSRNAGRCGRRRAGRRLSRSGAPGRRAGPGCDRRASSR